jgi:tetratricopeptide (TPR) repeat protein
MAKKKIQPQTDSLQSVEKALSKTELFFEENQKLLIRIVAVIIVVIAIFVGTKRFYFMPQEKEAQSQMFVAEQYFESDSFNLALYGDGNYSGFLDIIDQYKLTKSGNLSKYYAGISFYKLGQYEDAISYLKKFRLNDKMVAPVAAGAIGDAYVELGELEEGLSYYYKAADLSENTFTTPMFLLKAGQVHESLGDYAGAMKLYERIKKDYPDFSRRRNIDKYITRARLNG